jgi:hypothetical protein
MSKIIFGRQRAQIASRIKTWCTCRYTSTAHGLLAKLTDAGPTVAFCKQLTPFVRGRGPSDANGRVPAKRDPNGYIEGELVSIFPSNTSALLRSPLTHRPARTPRTRARRLSTHRASDHDEHRGRGRNRWRQRR